MLCALAVVAAATEAAPVSAEHAVRRAEVWLSRGNGAHGRADDGRAGRGARGRRMRPSRAPSGRVRTCSADGTNLFHLVVLDGGGFVAVAADDARATPVMGFADAGDLPTPGDGNPLWTILGADAQNRLTPRAAPGGRHAATPRGGVPGRARRRDVKTCDAVFTLQTIDAATGGGMGSLKASSVSVAPVKTESGLDDVRVSPLVQSKWDQDFIYRSSSNYKTLYNYYTPNGWPCGCVATAMAQLMKFHRFPTTSVTAQTFICWTNDVAVSLTMKGGVYDWDLMPDVPTWSITDAQREAIGRLCHDAGVSMRMQYESDGSGSFGALCFTVLKNVFGFSSAQCLYNITDEDVAIKKGILANLDAGCPVFLGISSDVAGGHAILADGYGYFDGTLFCHLNMGWSGSWDYWYALPEVDSYYYFDTLAAIVHNIFPSDTGELVTGRVLTPKGVAVSGATVHAQAVYTTGKGKTARTVTQSISATTSESGVYAVRVPTGVNCTVTLYADYRGWATETNTTATTSSVSLSDVTFSTTTPCSASAFGWNSTSIGNSWGNDIVVTPPVRTVFSIR